MPKSQVRDEVKRSRAQRIDREIKRAQRERRDWRQRVAVPLIIAGAVWFIAGQIGARTGIMSLPFDPHHIFSQVAGALVALRGLMWLR